MTLPRKHPAAPLKISSCTKNTCETWHFQFDPSGYAYVSLDAVTGTFAITSDWGNWAYIWNPGSVGGDQDVKKFIGCRTNTDYLAKKLTQGQCMEEFDADATKAAWKKYIEEEADDVGQKQQMLDLLADCDWSTDSVDLFIDHMDIYLWEFLGELDDMLEMRPSYTYLALRDLLLPVIQAQFKEEIGYKEV